MKYRPSSEIIQDKCTSGCPVLDSFLHGGLPCGLLIELSGEATAAKTQICLQALLCTQWPQAAGGLAGSSLYIYTEGDPPFRRLQELASLQPTWHSRSRRSIFDNIFIEQGIDTGEDLLHCLQRIPALLQKTPDLPLRTVVVDSIGHIFRDAETATGGGSGNVHRDRTVLLFQVAALLKRLASQHNLLVLICNQVYDVMEHHAGSLHAQAGLVPMLSSGRHVLPALGISWASCINMRIFLTRNSLEQHNSVSHQQPGAQTEPEACSVLQRAMHVMFAPHLPPSSCDFVLSAAGLAGVAPVTHMPGQSLTDAAAAQHIKAAPALGYMQNAQHKNGQAHEAPQSAHGLVLGQPMSVFEGPQDSNPASWQPLMTPAEPAPLAAARSRHVQQQPIGILQQQPLSGMHLSSSPAQAGAARHEHDHGRSINRSQGQHRPQLAEQPHIDSHCDCAPPPQNAPVQQLPTGLPSDKCKENSQLAMQPTHLGLCTGVFSDRPDEQDW